MGSREGSPDRPAVLRARSARGPAENRTARPRRLQPPQSRRCREYSSLIPRLPTPVSRIDWQAIVFAPARMNASIFDDAAEADMAGRGVDRLGMARRGAIAPAIVGRAQMRAALQDLPWDTHGGLARIVARLDGRTARIRRHAAGLGRVGSVLGRIPVGRPFPDIADHVVYAVAVDRKGANRRGAGEAVGPIVVEREVALPGVGHVLAGRRELLAPGELCTVEAAARGELPFGFGRQFLARPFGIGLGVLVGDLHHWMVVEPADVAALAVGPAPVGAEGEAPPLAPVAQVDRLLRLGEDKTACLQHVRQGAGIVLPIGRDLGEGDVAYRFDELAELGISDRRRIDPEAVDGDAMDRR